MPEPNLFLIFVSRLNASGMRYMITGAVASIIYGEPRLTHDIDLVLELDDAGAQKLAALRLVLKGLGVKPGNRVLVPVYSCVALANATLACGATPDKAKTIRDRLKRGEN